MDNELTQQQFDAKNRAFSSEGKNSSLSLSTVAEVALEAGKMLMEAGGNAKSIERIAQMIAQGLRAERVELRIGYASLSITIGIDEDGITRMNRIGEIGVNQRLIQQLLHLGNELRAVS